VSAVALRLFRIGWAIAALLLFAARQRLRPQAEVSIADRLRATLERLGPTFVKLGQALSLRRDVLPDEYVAALRQLQHQVAPFPAALARREVERELGRSVEAIFADFEDQPLAAASIAQVHLARLDDGTPVIVKVRRPHIRAQIDRDMRILVAVLRLVVVLAPRLQRFRPVELVKEVWTNLRKETDFRQEARNIRRFVEAVRGLETVYVPGVVDDLYGESVLVQELSEGRAIDDPEVRGEGPRLAQVLVDLYLHQFFAVGLFHGDPHPGNLFVMADGRVCFHDLGLVGFLDRPTRRALATFLQAFVHQDAGWTLDAAIELGILRGGMDRAEFQRGIEEILADYAALPLKDWSLAEAMLRVARLGRGESFLLPQNLVVLMRTLFILESVLRDLDPEFRILDTLLARGAETLQAMMAEAPATAALARLKYEAALTAQDLPAVLGAWLRKAQHEGTGLPLTVRLEGVEDAELRFERTGNRLALALVTLGLYVAASLLMQHSIGPRLVGDLPLLAALGYGLALWFTFRLAAGIARSGRL
jgi:ubiquinone biosynthesis protein